MCSWEQTNKPGRRRGGGEEYMILSQNKFQNPNAYRLIVEVN